MNERIKELAAEAGLISHGSNGILVGAEIRFVELIIKECVDHCVEYAETMSDISDSVKANATARARIKDCAGSLFGRFGVKNETNI